MGFEIVRLYQGSGISERLVLEATSNDNIGRYIVLDSTYEASGGISNHFRHVYWFPDQDVKKGEKVILYTKKGIKDYEFKPPNKEVNVGTHFFFWGVDHNVWNDNADSVTLIEVADFDFKQFKDIHVKK